MTAERDFLEAYDRLSEHGRCDCPGGMEYKRVLQEWQEAGRPANLDDFIPRHANMRSNGTHPDYVPEVETSR